MDSELVNGFLLTALLCRRVLSGRAAEDPVLRDQTETVKNVGGPKLDYFAFGLN